MRTRIQFYPTVLMVHKGVSFQDNNTYRQKIRLTIQEANYKSNVVYSLKHSAKNFSVQCKKKKNLIEKKCFRIKWKIGPWHLFITVF